MPKISLYSTSHWADDGRFYVIGSVVQRHQGPFALAKKGRDIMKKNAETGQATATADQSNAQNAYNSAQGLLQQDIGFSTPGSLTPAASAQLAADTGNIARTYNGLRQNAFATLGARGVASAPGGLSQATTNALNVGEEGADTGAFRNAQVNTQNQRNFATQQEGSLAGQQGSLGNQALAGSTNAAVDLNKAGSTAGDILGGIAAAAPIIAAPFTGGASLIPSLAGSSNPFSKIGSTKGQTGAGIGGYGGVTGG